MKKTYIKPEVRVRQIVAPRIMTASGDAPYVVIEKDKDDNPIFADQEGEVLSRRSTNLWDDFEEEEW